MVKYRITDEHESWYRFPDAEHPTAEAILEDEIERQKEFLSPEYTWAEISIYLVLNETDNEDDDDDEEFIDNAFVCYEPPVPDTCVAVEDKDCIWRVPDKRTGLPEDPRGGYGLTLTWFDQCRRCRLIRKIHKPNNRPDNQQNNGEYYEITYCEPQYSDWICVPAHGVSWRVEIDEPADEVDVLELLQEQAQAKDVVSLQLYRVLGEDEYGEELCLLAAADTEITMRVVEAWEE